MVRICSPIRPNAGCLAVYVQKAGVVAAFGCLNLFLAFSAARNARARVVPNAHHRSVAAGAAFIEMRRIKRYFRYWQREHLGHSSARARVYDAGAAVRAAHGVIQSRPPAAPSSHGRAGRPALSLAALAGCWHPAPRARRAGLHSEENPAAAIQNPCCV